ncbi:hypothetical protein V5O48_012413 [Marasmius crinis-equi]|uniref:Uncharacterized protein n=1 Tax=Marasmius crinis-equi TaxID=585013 RepID=A0ABR3F2X3_9AGAR
MIKLSGDEEQLLGSGPSSPSSNDVPEASSSSIPNEPPPSFSVYSAEFFTDKSGNVVSHDPHLNSDGEALYRFLLSYSSIRPTIHVHCKATHQETRTRQVTSRHSDGRTHTRTETYNDTVTDFDFFIDISNVILPLENDEPVHWTSKDSEPAYRGRMFYEIEGHSGKRHASWAEKKAYKKWAEFREGSGLPPWVTESAQTPHIDDYLSSSALRSSKTVRQWADNYCGSPKLLKQFTYRKVVYGWNMDMILFRVRSAISAATGPFYRGDIQVNFDRTSNKIHIRPNNRLSRILSNVWLKILLWILLIYPFIWLYKRFHSKGGGRWEVCGGAYAMTRYVPLDTLPPPSNHDGGKHPDQPPPEYDVAAASRGVNNDRLKTTADGRQFIRQGVTELEWLAKWESSIVRAVRAGHQSTIPLPEPVS